MTIRTILAGQLATFSGVDAIGWVRRPCPSDGLLAESDELTVFISAAEMRAALAEIDDLSRKRRRR